jgi:hypothetical protein
MKKFILSATVLFTLIGCGGGGDVAKISVITTNIANVAFKAKNGNWQEMQKKDLGNNKVEYFIKYSGKYQIALKCLKSINIYALDSKDVTKINKECTLSLGSNSIYKGTLKDNISNADSYVYFLEDKWGYQNGNSVSFQIDADNFGLHDFVAVSLKNQVPQRFFIKRDFYIPLNQDNIVFTQNNSATISTKNFTKSNTTGKAEIYLITKNDTYLSVSNSTNWRYPNGLLTNDDLFLIYAKTNNNYLFKVYDANSMPKTDISVDFSYVNDLSQISYSNNSLSGFNQYVVSNDSQPLKGFLVTLSKNNYNYFLVLSKSYLQDDNDFEIEDLSAIDGFGNVWDGTNANSVEAYAIMSNVTFDYLFEANRYDKYDFLNIPMPLINMSQIEVAYQKVK